MCRYGIKTYKSHYACFECRKTFKRRFIEDINNGEKQSVEAKCPQCGQLMANMGLDFASPKKDNIKEWAHLKNLFSVGITFHSCGCSGPGYIPNTKEKLKEHLEEIKINYFKNLDNCRKRTQSKINLKIEKDIKKDWPELLGILDTQKNKSKIKQDEINYWLDRINQVEQKIEKIK